MNENTPKTGAAALFLTSLRCWTATFAVCCAGYTAAILSIAQIFSPYTANGSLVTDESGRVVGSEMLAQKFERPEYFHPRPSAADYNASGAAGSNLTPLSSAITNRAREIAAREGAAGENPMPADMAAASGSGLDPHVTLKSALFQAERVARARNAPVESVISLVEKHAVKTGGFLTPEPVINVLMLNMELDKREAMR